MRNPAGPDISQWSEYFGHKYQTQGLRNKYQEVESVIVASKWVMTVVRRADKQIERKKETMTVHSNDGLSWLTKLERIQFLHRVRQRLMKNRTALINQIRGLGLEYGITMPESAHKVEQCLPEHLKNAENELTVLSRQLFQEFLFELKDLQQRLKKLDKRLDHLNA